MLLDYIEKEDEKKNQRQRQQIVKLILLVTM